MTIDLLLYQNIITRSNSCFLTTQETTYFLTYHVYIFFFLKHNEEQIWLICESWFISEHYLHLVNQFLPRVAFHIETSHLFCSGIRLTSFFIRCNIRPKWVKSWFIVLQHESILCQCFLSIALENIRKPVVFWFFQKVRSSRPYVLCKKGVLKNLAKFTEKHLCQSLFSVLLKKKLWHRCFP